jgi:flagellar basal-body rod protein FlgB
MGFAMKDVAMNLSIPALFQDPTTRSLQLSLDASAVRHQGIANNIANVNTPGYKRVELSRQFDAQYKSALERLDAGQSVGRLPKASLETAEIQNPARLDGNTVNLDQELINLTANSTEYDFATRMLGRRYQGLVGAISTRSQ